MKIKSQAVSIRNWDFISLTAILPMKFSKSNLKENDTHTRNMLKFRRKTSIFQHISFYFALVLIHNTRRTVKCCQCRLHWFGLRLHESHAISALPNSYIWKCCRAKWNCVVVVVFYSMHDAEHYSKCGSDNNTHILQPKMIIWRNLNALVL